MTDHADALAEYQAAYNALTEGVRILLSITPDMTPAERTRLLRASREAKAAEGSAARFRTAARALKAAFVLEAWGEVTPGNSRHEEDMMLASRGDGK